MAVAERAGDFGVALGRVTEARALVAAGEEADPALLFDLDALAATLSELGGGSGARGAGTAPPSASRTDEAGVPSVTTLGAPYPNPSRGGVTIPLDLAAASAVRVAVYDVLGRRIAVLAEGAMEAGAHRLRLGGSALPSGVYVVRAVVEAEGLRGGARTFVHRLTLLR